jgi:hypothetical protein
MVNNRKSTFEKIATDRRSHSRLPGAFVVGAVIVVLAGVTLAGATWGAAVKPAMTVGAHDKGGAAGTPDPGACTLNVSPVRQPVERQRVRG